MPLDIEPLSPRRRAAMLLVLLALFGGSIGLAQILVNSRQAPRAEFVTIIRPPDGMVEPVPALEGIPGVVLTGAGALDGRPRLFLAFSYESDTPPGTSRLVEAEALRLFQSVLTQTVARGPGEEDVRMAPATLGRIPGYHLEGVFGRGNEQMFLVERMVAIPGRVVAICFSGPGPLTDADKTFFEELCNTSVTIRRDSQRSPNTRRS
jgi:hypothetical protein